MHIWVHACVHIHIHLTSQLGPPVRLGAPVPLWFLAYGIMLGRYFCLLGWLLDMVFIWIGNLFSFESIYSTEKRSGRMRGVWPSGACTDLLWHEEHGSTLVTWKRCMYSSASRHVADVFKVFLERFFWYTFILKGSQRVGVVFSWRQAHQLANLMANLCQSKMRVKWPWKSKYSPSFGWHLGDCSHSAHWYAVYYVLLTCSQWHLPALAPLR